MKKLIYIFLIMLVGVMMSCHDDLNQYPNERETSLTVFSKPENYRYALAKCYASYVTAGQEAGGGDADLTSNNGYDYMRCYFNVQEAGTDEIGSTWIEGDNIGDLTFLTWDATDPWVADMYYRCYYSVSLCNEFLNFSTEDYIAGFSDSQQQEIITYRQEARFLRALAYYHALDLFHDIAFVDESFIGTLNIPERIESADMFNFLTTELKSCSEGMLSAQDCEYGRAPRSAAWMLLSRMYLNAEVYEVGAKYDSCMIYTQKVMDEGYALESDYAQLFNADNDQRVGVGNEIIFPLVVDGDEVRSWGATTYLVCGEADQDYGYDPLEVGCQAAWGMFRIRGEVPALFDMDNDDRAMFYTGNQTQYMDNGVADRTGGYFVKKWSNLTSTGEIASNTASVGVNTDFPLFRLADAYLMYAESAARTNTNVSTALALLNDLRSHRGAASITESEMMSTSGSVPFKFFLDERARELYWECVRRTDLIRFGCFTSANYLWQWKGGTKDGKAVDSKYKVYPIPSAELSANPNLYNEDY